MNNIVGEFDWLMTNLKNYDKSHPIFIRTAARFREQLEKLNTDER